MNSIRLATPVHEDADCRQSQPCLRCRGVGRVKSGAVRSHVAAWNIEVSIPTYDPCPDCHGTGRIPYWSDEGRGDAE